MTTITLTGDTPIDIDGTGFRLTNRAGCVCYDKLLVVNEVAATKHHTILLVQRLRILFCLTTGGTITAGAGAVP